MEESELESGEDRSAAKETQPVEMKSASDSQDFDSPIFGSLSDAQDPVCRRRASVTRVGHSIRGSRSSSPTSGTDYQSCSNPSTPEKAASSERDLSETPPPEVVSSVKMSANVANKLNQMRVSLEHLDTLSQSSFEEVESVETPSSVRRSEPPPGTGTPSPSRRSSLKPSLRQVFPYISCLPFENNIVFCFVLSVWDNIVGPQTVYVWRRKIFPSQKTFDGLLDEIEGIEVAEDGAEMERVSHRSRRMSQQPEDCEATPGPEREMHKQDVGREGRYTSSKAGSSSSHPENSASSHVERQPSRQLGHQTAAVKRDQFSINRAKWTSAPGGMPGQSGSRHDVPQASVGTVGNDIEVASICADDNSSKPQSLSNFKTASIDNASLCDIDCQGK